MQQVYWMGGSPCAGKTTIAHILAQEYGWQTYHIDRHVETYLKDATDQAQPTLCAYRRGGLRAFLSDPPQKQLEAVQAISHEQFSFILAAVRKMDDSAPILIEGANMLVQDVLSAAVDLAHIIWLVPTEEFLLRAYPRRGTWVQDVLRQNFPEEQRLEIFDHWMLRDSMMAEWTANEARKHDVAVITVDGSQSIRENAALVAHYFGLPNI